jgi:hypothetical protein
MVLPYFFRAALIQWVAGPEETKSLAGEEAVLRQIQIRLNSSEFEKISLACQANSLQARIADSSYRNAVSFSSAHSELQLASS